eukprot:4942851-Ditylum_brightwellii.AAC.1
MPFELGDLVYANLHVDGGYHQVRIDIMVINTGRYYFISWINLADPSISDMFVPRHHVRGYTVHPIDMCNRTNHNLFELVDMVYAKHPIDGRHHQVRIEMVIDNARHYLISWANQVDPSRSDILVHGYYVMVCI